MTIRNRKILYLNASDNQRKFYGINHLKNGDSVLLNEINDDFICYLYTKKKVMGKWFISVTDFDTSPSYLFAEN